MTQKKNDAKSCAPQHLEAKEPDGKWTVEELGRFAQAQHQSIAAGEKLLALGYWKLGGALEILRQNFNHGQWCKCLDELGIDRTRASKARCIRRTFEREVDIQGLTVAEAYGRRKRKHRRRQDSEADFEDEKHALANFIKDVRERAKPLIHDAAFAEQEEALLLLPSVYDAIRLLEEIHDQLKERADSPKSV